MLGNRLQQTTSADDIFRCIIFLGALRVNHHRHIVDDPLTILVVAKFVDGPLLCDRVSSNTSLTQILNKMKKYPMSY